MNTDQSYFARTNWFIWIGFTTSIVMILLVGFSLSHEWENQKMEIGATADVIANALIFIGILSSLWLQLKIKKMLTASNIDALSTQSQLTLFYTLFLLSNELFVMIGFYYGFILHDITRFYWYTGVSLACNLLTFPNVVLVKRKV